MEYICKGPVLLQYIFGVIVFDLVQTTRIPTTYLSETCFSSGLTVRTDTNGRIETSQQLWYEHNSDCVTTISADEGRRVLLLFNRFELETKLEGVCVDYLNIHDGPSISSNTLNPAPLCEKLALGNYSSTSNSLTLHFVSDETINARGFDVVYVAVEDEPCGTDTWFQCESGGVCINNELKCTEYNECYDGSDETAAICEEMEVEEKTNNTLGIIIGCSVGGAALILIILLIIYKAVDYYKYRKWLAKNGLHDDPWAHEDKSLQYPVTDRYVDYEFHQGRKLGRRNDAYSAEAAAEKNPTSEHLVETESRAQSQHSIRSIQSRPASNLSVPRSDKKNSISPATSNIE